MRPGRMGFLAVFWLAVFSLCSAGASLAAPGPLATLRVAHTPPYDFYTITAALSAASTGTTLLIADGNYSAATGEIAAV